MDTERTPTGEPELTWPDVLGWIEFGCWCALIMAPVIYWIQGPSVSLDQRISRTIVVLVAITGVIVLGWLRRQSKKRAAQ
jgi:membrane protein DedA with SNARE-associated domain